MDKKSRKAARKKFGRCGFLAVIALLFMGILFGFLATILAYGAKFLYPNIYLILLYPLIMAIFLGTGLYLGVRMGRCSRFSWVAFLLVTLFTILCYGSFHFLVDYQNSFAEKPLTVLDVALYLGEDGQNFLADLPWITDYVNPVEGVERADLGNRVLDFVTRLPQLVTQGEKPVIAGTIFEYFPLNYLNPYLQYPGITRWENEEEGILVFDERAVHPWMLWTVEWIVLWTISLMATKRATNKAFDALHERMKKRGGWQPAQEQGGLNVNPQAEPEEEPQKKKRSLFSFGRKKKKKAQKDTESADSQKTPEDDVLEFEETASEAEPEKDKKEKKKKKKKKRGWFGRKKKDQDDEQTEEQAEQRAEEMEAADSAGQQKGEEFPQEKRYALILHQFNEERRDDLLRLIQQIGKVSEDRAQRLLRPPSLLKQDVSAQEAQLAIEKFNQVGAEVKLITMEQLRELQKKQQKSAQSAAKPSASPSGGAAGERYALILRKIESSQRQNVLELLSSVSNTPVEQLQQTLKTPALVLRDASRDEAAMLAEQFKNISAEVKMLTMTDLKKLMAKK